jgi:hypothetical protein
MLENYFVSRRAYDRDLANQRARVSELTRELRDEGREKARVEQQLAMVKSQVGGLEFENERLVKRLGKQPLERDLIEYMPPVPEGETARKGYMAEVAGFFEGGLRDKLNYMHLQFRNQVGMFPLTERESDFFRSCINVVGLLLDWGEECVAEHRANVAGAHDKDSDNAFDAHDDGADEAVENISKAINR